MNNWNTFFAAMAGASATLTGLLFVGVSISLNRILATPKISGRALESLILLLTVLTLAALCLVPQQTAYALGIEILLISTVVWIITLIIDLGMLAEIQPAYKKHYRVNILFTQLSVLPYIIAGIMILLQGFTGIYWLVPGIIMTFIKAIMDGWVLLIEIHR